MRRVMADSPTPILANDFARQWQSIRRDALEAVDRVGHSGWLVLGEEVREFEREFAAWWGMPYAVGVASGLDALEIALRCADLPPGARVLTTPLTAFATTLAILRAGAQPLWCDVEDSGGLDLDRVATILGSDRSIRALIPVHLYGHPLDPEKLRRLCADYGVVIVEDCAQSAGAERCGEPTGRVGAAAATSLYPTKNLGAMGDGGVLLTGDAELAHRARILRDYGQRSRYEHVEVGLNSRLDEVQAAILRSASLPRLDGWLARRSEIASRYIEALQTSGLRPIRQQAGRSAHHLFPVEVVRRRPQEAIEGLLARGVIVGRHYPVLAPDQPAVRGWDATVGPLRRARQLSQREISLPIHPQLDDCEVEHVIEACLEVAS